MKKIILFLATIFLYGNMQAQVPAFPGAEGGGMYTTGGRSTSTHNSLVYYVTTLEDSDEGSSIRREGSLRWCLDKSNTSYPITIQFKVSGTISLKKPLNIKRDNVTIAGQTAPGDGICIGNDYVNISGSNIIIRYLRFRMGDDAAGNGGADALGGRFFKNVIVDHCSVSWSTDECASFYDCNYFTMQWCLISESLRLSKHDKGPHGYGGIWGGTNASFHHNLLAHHDSRTPRFGAGQNIPPHTETVDHRNNVIFNYGNTYGAEGMNVNMVNNFYKPGPVSSTGARRGRIMSPDKDVNEGSIRYNAWGQFFIEGNVVDDGKNEPNCIKATNDNWTYGVYNQFSSGYGVVSEADKAAMRMSVPFDIKGEYNGTAYSTVVTTHDARIAYDQVLEYAGACLKRDSYDERIINETRNGTTTFKGLSKYNGWDTGHPDAPEINWRSKNYPKLGIIDSHWDTKPSDAGNDWSPWPVLTQGEVPTDADRDGIPDGWLDSHGYDGKRATDINEEGYTYLEVYLNSLVEDITRNQNKNAITGINEEKVDDAARLVVFYNSNSRTLSIDSEKEMNSVSIYSLSGMLLYSSKLSGSNTVLDIPSIGKGFLLIKVVLKDKNILSSKIVI